MNNRILFAAIVLLAFVIIGFTNMSMDREAITADNTATPLDADFDYYITGMELTRFTPEGIKTYFLGADKVTHFPDGDIAILENPAMHWYATGREPWQVSARDGVMRTDYRRGEDSVILEHHVVADRAINVDDLLHVTTERLTIYPASKEITTDQVVNLQTNDTRLQSTGLLANLAEDRIQLLADVKGIHD